MAVRAIRGAIQLDVDEREHLLACTRELVTEVLRANDLPTDDLISIVFTVTADLRSEFPALAARELGLPVVIMARPPLPARIQVVTSVAEATEWVQRRRSR